MFDKTINAIKSSTDKRRAEKLLVEKERKVAETEAINREAEKLQAEKERLLSLEDKELMVELIFAVRGFHARVSEIEEEMAALSEDIRSYESRIATLEARIHEQNNRL